MNKQFIYFTAIAIEIISLVLVIILPFPYYFIPAGIGVLAGLIAMISNENKT